MTLYRGSTWRYVKRQGLCPIFWIVIFCSNEWSYCCHLGCHQNILEYYRILKQIRILESGKPLFWRLLDSAFASLGIKQKYTS